MDQFEIYFIIKDLKLAIGLKQTFSITKWTVKSHISGAAITYTCSFPTLPPSDPFSEASLDVSNKFS